MDCKSHVCDEVLSPCPPLFSSFGTLNYELFCSPISPICFDVHEDHVLDGVGVQQKNCDIIYNEYVWEPTSELEYAMKDYSFPSTPFPH